jgi:hypothetical protein
VVNKKQFTDLSPVLSETLPIMLEIIMTVKRVNITLKGM